MLQRILVAYEGSNYSNNAFARALEIAGPLKAEIYVLSVIKLPEPLVDAEPASYIDSATAYYQKCFTDLNNQASKAGVKATFNISVGSPAEAIIECAQTQQSDLIIVGFTKGRSFLQKLVIGSVSKQVVDYAQCSVMVVH